MTEIASRGVIPEETLGERLARSLRFAGMKNEDMARTLGVSANTVRNYMAERTKMQRGTIALWAWTTGVDQRWLESGVRPAGDNPTPDPDGGIGVQRDALSELTASKMRRSSRNSHSGGVTSAYPDAA